MRLLSLILFIIYSPIANADTLLGSFDLNIGAGIRMGKEEKTNKMAKVYTGVKVSHTEFKFSGKNKLAIFSPGINLDTDLIFTVTISPIIISVPEKLSIGIDYFLSKSNNSGNIGLFIGIPFGQSR